MRIVAAVALYGIVWPPILIVWSVTDDSSFGGGAGASAGFSAGLDSCGRALSLVALSAITATSSTRRFFTRIMGSLLHADLVQLGLEILTVSTKLVAILLNAAEAKTLHHRPHAPRTVPRSYRQSNQRPLRGVRRRWP